MDSTSLFILMLPILFVLSIFSIWLAGKFRIILNDRCKNSLSKIDSERSGDTKHYFVHMVWRKRDYTYGMYGFVIIGNFFMFIIPSGYSETMSEEVMTLFTLLMASISLIIAFGFPAAIAFSASKKSSEVLVVVDSGIEVWKVKKEKVRMFGNIKWSDITKFRAYRTNAWCVDAVYLYIGKKWILVREDEVNMLQFIEDLQRYIPNVIKASGPVN